MAVGRVLKVFLIFAVTLTIGAAFLFFGSKVGMIWFGEYVEMFGELTFSSLSKDTIAGIFNKGYGSYVVVSLGFWLLGAFMILWSLISLVHRFICVVGRDCYHCKKYLTCHSPAKGEKEF